VLGAAWDKAFHKDELAGIYRRWQESFQSPEAGEREIDRAFEEFFCREPVTDELAKVLRDRYAKVDFEVLIEQLRESFEWAGCPEPEGDVYAEIDGWIRDLQGMIEEKKPSMGLRPGSEAPIENVTLARKKYLESVVRQHRYLRFSGLAEVSGPTEVEMARVFVMPRVTAQSAAAQSAAERDPKKSAPAYRLLTAKKAPRRCVILGGPGSGKTTLLEAFALGAAKGAKFRWTREFPQLLPVFYRVRDLDQDLEEHGTIWDCIHYQCSRRLGATLPRGFFPEQMETGGLLLLFDGLDEAGSPASRNRIVDLVAEFGEGLSKNSRLLVTSRPHDYRHRFEGISYRHFELCEFDDGEIQSFIQGWRRIHEPDRSAAEEKGERLWGALQGRQDILPLARNALLLTMIVRVHFWLGALPDSRLGLYEKCTETLLKDWTKAAGLPESPIDFFRTHKLLERLAYEMQGEAEQLSQEMALQISRTDLARRFENYLEDEGCPDAFHLVEAVIHRLHARDAILVQYGTDQRGQDLFGFVHRSFQEYFAACWMAQELDEAEFQEALLQDREGWNETLYLAVAQLPDRRRRKTLLELLKLGRAEFAVSCLRAAPPEQPWLQALVRFLSRFTWEGRENEAFAVSACADACAGRAETREVLRAMFARDNREGQSLAAAVELAEELAQRGDEEARGLLDGFFAESAGLEEDMVEVAAGAFPYGEGTIEVPAFSMDRYPVTNLDYERMIPGHAKSRNRYSDADRQPVILVSWHEARLYCRWRGRGCRLPSEQEWEKAASWDAVAQRKRVYPWGDDFDASRCNTSESWLGKTSVVGAYPGGRSSYGCEDMAGNVFAWTESPGSEGSEFRVLRGGAWFLNHELAACAFRSDNDPQDRSSNIGFRCSRT